jgi:hypothetical protein
MTIDELLLAVPALQRPIISDYVTLRAAAVTVRRPHGRGDRRPEGVHVDFYEAAGRVNS